MEGAKIAMELAAQVPRHLQDLDFPVGKQDIVRHAREQRANETLVRALEKIPDGVYTSVAEVADHVGGGAEGAGRE